MKYRLGKSAAPAAEPLLGGGTAEHEPARSVTPDPDACGSRADPVAEPTAPPTRGWAVRGFGFGVLAGLAVLALLVAMPALAPARAPAVPAAVADPVGVEDVPCWFTAPVGHQARCGILIVPERRGAAQGRSLRLRFVVLREGPATGLDPIVYISGGPGEPTRIDAASIGSWWSWFRREPWLKGRDLVLFDQRGVGMSEPRMECPEVADAAYRVLSDAVSVKASNALWAAAAATCHARLAATGIDLASYNTAAIAADLKSLLARLDYRSPVLLASSYGTRVALRLAADPAVGARAMVLDAVDPPDASEYIDSARNAASAFARLFENCAEDPACDRAFPKLAESFERVVRRAGVQPLTVALADPRGKAMTARLDDAKLIELLFYAFYDPRRLEELPAIISALAAGDTAPLKPLLRLAVQNYNADEVSLGLFLSVECHDNFPFNPRAAVERASATAPLFRNFALANLPLAACPVWPSGSATELDRAPFSADVPVLMLSGDLDPATPPDWAARTAARLPHGYNVKFHGIGHGVLGERVCASRLVGHFLADPLKQPVDDCQLAASPPKFRKLASAGTR